jgi:hypothetical protein
MKRILSIGCLSAFACCVILLTIWALPSLLPPSDRNPPIIISDLLLTKKDFPLGWRARGTPQSEYQNSELYWGEENLYVEFQPIGNQGYAYQYIFKFRNKLDAKYGLFRIKQQDFLTPSKNNFPNEWSYKSPIADDWLFGCLDEKECTVLARYDEFILAFTTSIDPKYMTFADLESILRTIDEKMSKYSDTNPD